MNSSTTIESIHKLGAFKISANEHIDAKFAMTEAEIGTRTVGGNPDVIHMNIVHYLESDHGGCDRSDIASIVETLSDSYRQEIEIQINSRSESMTTEVANDKEAKRRSDRLRDAIKWGFWFWATYGLLAWVFG